MQYALKTEKAKVRVFPFGRDSWMFNFTYNDGSGSESEWFPTLRRTKEEAVAVYKIRTGDYNMKRANWIQQEDVDE